MSETNIWADLLAAQQEMPSLQKTAINPHFKSRFVPLEELIERVVPVLNRHNLILLQQPTVVDGQPALRYRLVHVSGVEISDTMLLCVARDDPQGQGSAITYARRYSLMALLGLTADADDDGASAPRPAQRANGTKAEQPKRTFVAYMQERGVAPQAVERESVARYGVKSYDLTPEQKRELAEALTK